MSSSGPDGGAVSMDVTNTASQVTFVLQVSSLADRTVRVRMTEKNGLGPRHEVQEVLQLPLKQGSLSEAERTTSSATFNLGDQTSVVVNFSPLRIDVLSGGEVRTRPTHTHCASLVAV